jgi:hypothetical protein
MTSEILDRCFTLPKHPPVFIQLGRLGDLLILFPAFWLIHKRTGKKPIVIVADNYSNVFDGISYATPHLFHGNWFGDMPKARMLAEREYGQAIIPHWWAPGVDTDDVPRGTTVLQCHGKDWGVDIKRYSDFCTAMWLRAGFTREEMLGTPLVIDRRNPVREAALVQRYYRPDKPMVLYNFTGVTAPFPYTPEMLQVMHPYRRRLNLVDIGEIRAERIYDLLGLYDRAAGLITGDTATAHLAVGSAVPTVWLTKNRWSGSVPRGNNCVLHMKYPEAPQRMGEIRAMLDQWQGTTVAN